MGAVVGDKIETLLYKVFKFLGTEFGPPLPLLNGFPLGRYNITFL